MNIRKVFRAMATVVCLLAVSGSAKAQNIVSIEINNSSNAYVTMTQWVFKDGRTAEFEAGPGSSGGRNVSPVENGSPANTGKWSCSPEVAANIAFVEFMVNFTGKLVDRLGPYKFPVTFPTEKGQTLKYTISATNKDDVKFESGNGSGISCFTNAEEKIGKAMDMPKTYNGNAKILQTLLVKLKSKYPAYGVEKVLFIEEKFREKEFWNEAPRRLEGYYRYIDFAVIMKCEGKYYVMFKSVGQYRGVKDQWVDDFSLPDNVIKGRANIVNGTYGVSPDNDIHPLTNYQ